MNKNFIKEKMPRAKCYMPEGGYIIWIDFSGYGLTDEDYDFKNIHIIIFSPRQSLAYTSFHLQHTL